MASPEGFGGLSEALRHLLQADDKRFDHARQQGTLEPHQYRSWLIKRQDYFYVCPGHLKDRGFATPIIDEAEAAAKKKKEAMDREIELIKHEYEEKMKKQKNKDKDKDKKARDADKGKEEAKDDGSKDDGDDEKAKKEKDDKVSSVYQSRKRPLLTIMQDQSHYQQRTSVSR